MQVYFILLTYLLESDMANLAVVGAGIGGCCAAYFVHKHLPNVNVTLYDAQQRLGGRILTCDASGATLELGAAFFNGFNRTLLGIVEAEQLKVNQMEERLDFAVWNGSEFVFKSSKWSAATDLKLFAKYKQSLTRTFFLLRKARTKVANLYQQELENPSDIGALFESAGLNQWYSKIGRAHV
jgi:predicted NAD/FAD-binding protein